MDKSSGRSPSLPSLPTARGWLIIPAVPGRTSFHCIVSSFFLEIHHHRLTGRLCCCWWLRHRGSWSLGLRARCFFSLSISPSFCVSVALAHRSWHLVFSCREVVSCLLTCSHLVPIPRKLTHLHCGARRCELPFAPNRSSFPNLLILPLVSLSLPLLGLIGSLL